MKTYLEITHKEFNKSKKEMMEFYCYPKGSKTISPSHKNFFTAHWYMGQRKYLGQSTDFNVLRVKSKNGSYLEIPLSGWTGPYNRVLSRSTKEDLFGIFDSISRSYPEDSYRTIWEIYCHKFGLDYDTEDFEAEMFDEWVVQKDFLEKSK